jgi:hypothetical protein
MTRSTRRRGYLPGHGPGNEPRFGNGPPRDQPWIWVTCEMLGAPAWRALPLNSRKVIDQILIEHMHHAGSMNGQLKVTYDDFCAFGIRRTSIKEAIEIAEALGWIDVIARGGRSFGNVKRPSAYALTFLPLWDGTARTNRWKRIDAARAKILVRQAKERLEYERSKRASRIVIPSEI